MSMIYPMLVRDMENGCYGYVTEGVPIRIWNDFYYIQQSERIEDHGGSRYCLILKHNNRLYVDRMDIQIPRHPGQFGQFMKLDATTVECLDPYDFTKRFRMTLACHFFKIPYHLNREYDTAEEMSEMEEQFIRYYGGTY